MRDEEVEVWKLLIANLISKHQKQMSAKKLPFSEIYIKNLPVSEFSLLNSNKKQTNKRTETDKRILSVAVNTPNNGT